MFYVPKYRKYSKCINIVIIYIYIKIVNLKFCSSKAIDYYNAKNNVLI